MTMRACLLVLVLISIACYANAQQGPLRGRIRKLIQAARSGDVEARETLKTIRERLIQNRQQKEGRQSTFLKPTSERVTSRQNVQSAPPQRQPARESVRLQPLETPSIPEIPTADVVEQTQVRIQPARQPTFEPQTVRQPSRQPTFQPQAVRSREPQITRQRFESPAVTFEQSIDFEPHTPLQRGLEIDTRSELFSDIRVTNRTKTPPIQTIRRYSYFDPEGNYIFGYEAEDGSFKEEKRGLDCVVHGKYGYVDPLGIRREYTYISGNKCDPNAKTPEEEFPESPLNRQFTRLTQQKLLTEEELGQIRTNFENRPVSQTRRQPASRPVSRPRQTFSRQRQPEVQTNVVRQRTRPVQRRPPPVQNIQVSQPIPTRQTQPRITAPTSSVLPPFPGTNEIPTEEIAPAEPEIVTPAPFEPPTTFRRPLTQNIPAKRPSRPQTFNFDNEFNDVFQNFATRQRRPITTRAPPRPQTTPAPITTPPRRPTIPPPPPAPVSSPFRPSSKGHQLVFDATSGTFRSVPIEQLAKAKHIGALKIPSGKPLPQLGAPLPTSLTGSTRVPSKQFSPKQVNDLFNHFRIRV